MGVSGWLHAPVALSPEERTRYPLNRRLGGSFSRSTRCMLVVYLPVLFQRLRLYSPEWRGDKWIMNCKGCGRRRSLPCFNYYPSIAWRHWEQPRKSQDSRSPSRDLNPGPPEYEAGVLTTRPRRSVCNCSEACICVCLYIVYTIYT
jgi:hypothetical protein